MWYRCLQPQSWRTAFWNCTGDGFVGVDLVNKRWLSMPSLSSFLASVCHCTTFNLLKRSTYHWIEFDERMLVMSIRVLWMQEDRHIAKNSHASYHDLWWHCIELDAMPFKRYCHDLLRSTKPCSAKHEFKWSMMHINVERERERERARESARERARERAWCLYCCTTIRAYEYIILSCVALHALFREDSKL